MSPPTLLTRVLLVTALLLLATIGVAFYFHQNLAAGAGGPISRPRCCGSPTSSDCGSSCARSWRSTTTVADPLRATRACLPRSCGHAA